MTNGLSNFGLYTMGSAMRSDALEGTKARAEELGATELLTVLAVAIAHERDLDALEKQWEQQPKHLGWGPKVQMESRRLEAEADMLRTRLRMARRRLPASDERVAQLEAAETALYPKGMKGVVHVSYIDKLLAVERMMTAIEARPWLRKMRLSEDIDDFSAQVTRYREALQLPDRGVSFSAVEAARKEGQRLLASVVGLIMGLYFRKEDASTQAYLLAPILEQNEMARQRQKAKSGRRKAPKKTAGKPVESEKAVATHLEADALPTEVPMPSSKDAGSTPAGPEPEAKLRRSESAGGRRLVGVATPRRENVRASSIEIPSKAKLRAQSQTSLGRPP